MQQRTTFRIAIVGAGASGSLLALQLCRQPAEGPLHIYLFEKAPAAGPGLAYSTPEPLHLLNVPAGKMSALPDEPRHFLDWLRLEELPYGETDFVPRGVYGQYLHESLSQVISERPPHVEIERQQAEVQNIVPHQHQAVLQMKDGRQFTADRVVLALGNYPPAHPSAALAALAPSVQYAPDPWAPGIFDHLRSHDSVLLVGTGLTMIDMVMSLYARHHRGPVRAVSTHGHLPNVHQKEPVYAGVSEQVASLKSVKEWVSYIRSHVTQAAEQGIGWRAVIDAFRPYSQAFWLQLSLAEKKRFMQHLRHIWGVSRHRMPPSSAAIVQQMLDSGQLTIQKGRITEAEEQTGRLLLTLQDRKGSQTQYEANLVVNCTGPESDFRRVPSPLVRQLLRQGIVSADPLRMGFAALPDGRLLDSGYNPSELLYSLGPPLKGVLWESTAIPEIRQQAAELARLLLKQAALREVV